MGIREDLKDLSKQIADKAGYHEIMPTLVGEVHKQEYIDKYGENQVKQWVENNEIYFVPEIKL